MGHNYQDAFKKFLKKARTTAGTSKAHFKLLDKIPNVVILSGEITGADTQETLDKLGHKFGLLVVGHDLAISYKRS